jgi:diguanylate cyclase (GGDEF)-like protein
VARGVFAETDIGLLITLTTFIAVAVENARAAQLQAQVAAAGRERDVAEALRGSLAELSGVLDPDQVLARLLHGLRGLLGADGAWVLSARDPATMTVAEVGGPERPAPAVEPIGPVAAALLAATGPATGTPAAGPPPLPGRLDRAGRWLALPLDARDARVGVALLAWDGPGTVGDQVELATALVAQGMVAYENARLFSTVQRLATTDELTGVANRRHLLELAAHRLDPGRQPAGAHPATLMMIDIDHFKRINDTHGHQVGDQVLRAVAERIGAALPAGGLLGRYGGEEFVALAGAGPSAGRRVLAAVSREPVPTAAGPVPVTVSIGVVAARPGQDLTGLLERADRALYRAKDAGRDRLCEAPD